jgi:hypothetical protein
MQTKWEFAGSTEMWSTSAGGHLMKVVNLTGFTVLYFENSVRWFLFHHTLSLRSSLSVSHQVSHPYKTMGKTTCFCNNGSWVS